MQYTLLFTVWEPSAATWLCTEKQPFAVLRCTVLSQMAYSPSIFNEDSALDI